MMMCVHWWFWYQSSSFKKSQTSLLSQSWSSRLSLSKVPEHKTSNKPYQVKHCWSLLRTAYVYFWSPTAVMNWRQRWTCRRLQQGPIHPNKCSFPARTKDVSNQKVNATLNISGSKQIACLMKHLSFASHAITHVTVWTLMQLGAFSLSTLCNSRLLCASNRI